jgi:hypothetical protein
MQIGNHGKRIEVRSLTQEEIVSLEQALGAPIEKEYLVHWVSQSIADAIKLAGQPTPRQMRDMLLRIERDGRQWLLAMEESEAAAFLAVRANLSKFTTDAAIFCDSVASLAQKVDAVVRGHPRTSIALELFADRMIGIAKQAKVLPSTPSRRAKKRAKVRAAGCPATRKRAKPPAFFKFVVAAICLARTVIRTSRLSEQEQAMALSQLQYQSIDTLNKLVVKLRGQIGNYRPTPYGLVERKSD